MKVVVGKASPQSQDANPNVRKHTAYRPDDGVHRNLLAIKIKCQKVRLKSNLKHYMVLLLEKVNSCQNEFEHQVDYVDDYE